MNANLKRLSVSLLIATFLAAPLTVSAVDAKPEKPKKVEKPKPYPLTTCAVSDEKLGEMGTPYTFTYQGQEIKLCCKDCRKEFDKTPAKFMKKVAAAEKKAEKPAVKVPPKQ